MSLSTQHIVRHLFRVESLEEVSRQQLEELVSTYPSFGVGRYLLSRKLQAEAADNFVEETLKTNLYFTNPFWLQWLLQDAAAAPVNRQVHVEEFKATDPVTESIVPDAVGTPPAEAVEEVREVPVVVTDGSVAVTGEPAAMTETEVPSAADELLKSIAAIHDQRREAQEAQEARAPAEEEKEEAPSMSIAGLALEQLEEPEPPVAEEHIGQEQQIHEVDGGATVHSFVEGVILEEETTDGQPAQDSGEDGKAVWETEGEEEAPIADGDGPIQEVQSITEVHSPVQEVQSITEVHSPIIEEAQPVAAEKPSETVVPAEGTPVFEPFHTVDYFASQGIRLVLDENPTDKLGKQMKSFTDWLKIMRRLPQKNREIIPDIAAEHQIQAIAAHSIERREVITETMADVLAKQGMREKATEMYRKLSLLEPEKSAYFAEKIEKLKII